MYKKIYKNMSILTLITLVCTAVLILASSYMLFSSRLKNEIKDEAVLLSEVLNYADDDLNMLASSKTKFAHKRVTLIAADGSVLYDNIGDYTAFPKHNDRPEVRKALETGIGEAQRSSDTAGIKYYYCAVRLDDGNILRFAGEMTSIYRAFSATLIPVCVLIILLYCLAAVIAKRLTRNIIDPINRIDPDNELDEPIYEELSPFVRKIKRQSREIREKIESLRLQKTRLDTISENMNEGLVVLDEKQKVLLLNKSASAIFGCGTYTWENKDFIYVTRSLDLEEMIRSALDGEKGTDKTELDGNIYQVFYSPVYEKKAIVGVILLLFDISEEMKIETMRREFSANVSHELKTPLTSVLGYAQLIKNGMARQEDVQKFAGKIEKESAHLISLINDIMALSKLDEQTAPAQREEINLFAAAKDTAYRLREKADAQRVAIHVEGEDCWIQGSYQQISELIYNLCENAVKYNRQNGKVCIRVVENAVSVTDTGIGIAKEEQERIFERFYRVDKSHSKAVEGTGLGLSIVKHIAMSHHASISINSTLGEGTQITVRFPRKAEKL